MGEKMGGNALDYNVSSGKFEATPDLQGKKKAGTPDHAGDGLIF